MSTSSAALARPAVRRSPVQGRQAVSRPELRLVTRPRVRRSDARFAIVCAVIALLGLVGTLLANIALAEGSFELERLRTEQTALRAEENALVTQVRDQSSPARLAQRAERMGMVPAPSRQFIRLSDGRAIGVAEAAEAPSAITVAPERIAAAAPFNL